MNLYHIIDKGFRGKIKRQDTSGWSSLELSPTMLIGRFDIPQYRGYSISLFYHI